MNYSGKYWILGGVSAIIVWIISNIAGNYDERLKEILSSHMVFVPLVFVGMIIIEGSYHLFKWIYRKYK